MEMVSQRDHDILKKIFQLIESTDLTDPVFLQSEELEQLHRAGYIQPYDELIIDTNLSHTEREISAISQWMPLATFGIRVVISDGEFSGNKLSFYKISMTALKEHIDKLDGKQTVSSGNRKPDDHPQQGKETKWKKRLVEENPAFRVALPSDTTVSMEVKVLEPVRKASKELAAARGMTAQQLVENLLVEALNNSPKELEQGKNRLKEFKGSTAAARRFAEREELARLRQLTATPHR